MKTNRILLFIAIITFSFSCNKPAEVAPQEFACENSAKISKQSFGDLAINIEYANGKISKVYRADGQGLIENYTYKANNEVLVERKFSDGSVGNTFNGTLNSQGFFTKYSQISQTNPYSIVSTYDSEGAIKTQSFTYPSSPNDNSNIVFEYANGNLVKSQTFQKNVVIYTTDYTYFEDQPNKADLLRNGNQPDFFGKISKNLLKTIKTTFADKKTELYEYDFDVNSNGFVKSLTEKYTDKAGKVTNQTNKYEYVCL